jgi:hypothetical protein
MMKLSATAKEAVADAHIEISQEEAAEIASRRTLAAVC